MGQSLVSFATTVGQEKYYACLICHQEKHLHFQEKSREKSGKNTMQDVYEPWPDHFCLFLFLQIFVSCLFMVNIC